MEIMERLIGARLRRSKRPNLLSVFKQLRDDRRLSMFGDWPLLSEVLHLFAKKGVFYSPKEVSKVFRTSDDALINKLRTDSELVIKLTSKDLLLGS